MIDKVLHRLKNAHSQTEADTLRVYADGQQPVVLTFASSRATVLRREANGLFVLPYEPTISTLSGDSVAWLLPHDVESELPSLQIVADGAAIEIEHLENETRVSISGVAEFIIRPFANRPRCDVFGHGFSLRFDQYKPLEKALAAFYWDTMLPSVAERTLMDGDDNADGFVMSTLDKTSHRGTYPDVDHEFQIKGRMVMGNELDWSLVRRMMELQLRMMREDPEGLWRNPCAVQPNGEREYLVRRKSKDGLHEAEMFRVTGNIEILEEAWLYVAASKDDAWLQRHIADLEGAASLVEHFTSANGDFWSDVYYEDQVIKDGRSAKAAAFAINGFELLAQLEERLGRSEKAAYYRELSTRIARNYVQPLPLGFWDAEAGRFVDWIAQNGDIHDHLHLLTNVLPSVFGFATPEQQEALKVFLQKNDGEFQRFPSFMAADIASYNDGEIGDGGPYDLCAAGRYWCWDAAYRHRAKDGALLHKQLQHVVELAVADKYMMGERYDMDHVYYIDGKPWHGAKDYYSWFQNLSYRIFEYSKGL